MRTIILAAAVLFSCSAEEQWTPLFNGTNLDGWDTWLSVPNQAWDVPGMERDSTGEYTSPLGLNKDPLGVFTVSELDGGSVVHISGQGWGAITTKDEFENFHFSLEYKWGERRWAPRDSSKRDSGILYFCVGDHGAGSGAWMQSQECQVQEGDTGDYWSVAGAIVDVQAALATLDGQQFLKFDPEAPAQTIGKEFDGKNWNVLRCLKSETNEKPKGEWNRVDVYAMGGTAVHVVNGTTVMVVRNSRRIVDGKEVPLTRGKIQIQTEGAEVYYRDIKIRPISEIPASIIAN